MGERALPRYAIYYAPDPSDALWTTASALLGYDAHAARVSTRIVPAGWTPSAWHDATREPRRYGYHATLKAPFHLVEGASEADLVDAVRSFARSRAPVESGPVEVAVIDSFVALVPILQAPALTALAADCVRSFELFRAPLSPADRARRRPEQLDDLGRAYLDRYGYPYVVERFRFHMTLSGSLEDAQRDATRRSIAAILQDVVPPLLTVDRIAVFRQADRLSPFVVLKAFPLAG